MVAVVLRAVASFQIAQLRARETAFNIRDAFSLSWSAIEERSRIVAARIAKVIGDLKADLAEIEGQGLGTPGGGTATAPVVPPSPPPRVTAAKLETEAIRALNAADAERKRIIEEMRTPEEAMIARQQKLIELFDNGARNATTFGRAMAQASAFSAQNMDALASNVSSNLDAIFGESKAVAIAQALINTYQGISKAIATYPPPISTAMAAIQAAAGFAQVANIRKTTQSGGGSGARASAASGQVAGGAQSAQSGVQQSLLVQGISSDQLFSGDAVRGLAERLLDFQRDGGRVVLA
jgi:hypothetical protein